MTDDTKPNQWNTDPKLGLTYNQFRGGVFVAGLLGAVLSVTMAFVVFKFHPHLPSDPNRWLWIGVIFLPYLLSQLGLMVWCALKIFGTSRRHAASTPEAR